MVELVLCNLGGELDRKSVGQNETAGHRLLKLLLENDWILEPGDTILVEEVWPEEG